MNKFLFFILCIIIVSNYTNAQEIEIKGHLIDSLSHEDVPYVNIIVKNTKNEKIKECISNKEGDFKIFLKTKDSIKIEINSIAYYPKTIFISNVKNKIKFSNIILKPKINELNDAVITSHRKYVETKFDRKVCNISKIKKKSAQNIFDILKDLPGVVVDETGNIRFKGKNATIYRRTTFRIYLSQY